MISSVVVSDPQILKSEFLKAIEEEDEMFAKKRIIHRNKSIANKSTNSGSPRKNKKLLSINSEKSRSTDDKVSTHRPFVEKLKTESSLASENKKLKKIVIETPQADKRNFNENDIMGNIKKDTDGTPILTEIDGSFFDLDGRRVTPQGYLLD